MRTYISPLLAIIPLAQSRSILASRDIVFNDIIRFQKCSNLWKIVEGEGLWEMGQIAWWKSKEQSGAPDDRVVFDMSTPVGDYFWNDHGDMKDISWGGDIEGGGGSMRAQISSLAGIPEDGAYVGYIDRIKDGVQNRYNCHSTGVQVNDQFQYVEETKKNQYDVAWGTCSSWVECTQSDSVKLQIVATEEVTQAWELTAAPDIFKRFDEVFAEQGACREDKLDLDAKENKCTVQFECNSNGNKNVMEALRQRLSKLDYRMYKQWEKDVRGNDQCEDRGDCLFDRYQTWRSVPSIVLLSAHSIPDSPNEYGNQIAFIKAKVECEKPESSATDTICDSLGALFAAGSEVASFKEIMVGAGIATEIGCTIAKAVENNKD